MMMYEYPNIQKSYKFSQILGDNVEKKAKNLLGVLWQDKVGHKNWKIIIGTSPLQLSHSALQL